MIIDAHNHPEWHKHDFNKFIENMDQYNIDKTWLLTWECPEDEYDPDYKNVIAPVANNTGPFPFERCLEYKKKSPERFILGYAPDPRKPDAIDKLNAAVDIYGVQVYGELKLRMMYDNPDAINMYKFCGEKKLPVVVHIDYEISTDVKYPRTSYWYGGGIEALERALIQCPETIFLGHAPGFWAHISKDDYYKDTHYPEDKVVPGGKVIQMLDKYPNLFCDISAGSGINALQRDEVFAREFLIKYQDRILYGRDYFDNVHQDFLNALDLPEEVLNKIYSGNALRLTGQ